MGAIGEDGVRIVNDEVVRHLHVPESVLEQAELREREVLRRRADRFRGSWPRPSLVGRTAVIVDDGIATGSTAVGRMPGGGCTRGGARDRRLADRVHRLAVA